MWHSVLTLYPTMAVTACQGLGFVVSLIGIAGVIAATCMDQWSTQDLYNNPVTAVFNYQGLWRSCVRESSGFTECRGYFTLLGLPGKGRHLVGWRGRWSRRGIAAFAWAPQRDRWGGKSNSPTSRVGQECRSLRERSSLELSGLCSPNWVVPNFPQGAHF